MKLKDILKEVKDGSNKIPEADLILPRGKKTILQAEEEDYKRGLFVKLRNDGGYSINYWYGDDVKVYPIEVIVDGESIKPDAKEVYLKFHPKLKKKAVKEEITSQQFVDMVNDEFDVETLELMKQAIEKQITMLSAMQGIANRKTVKGFGS